MSTTVILPKGTTVSLMFNDSAAGDFKSIKSIKDISFDYMELGRIGTGYEYRYSPMPMFRGRYVYSIVFRQSDCYTREVII